MAGEHIHSQRHLRVACIGAGAAGLCFAYKLQRSFDDFSLSVYEKNADIGGTWFENQYPGCACDFPSHNYTYSFWPSSDFTQTYASGAEVLKYFKSFTQANDLWKYIKLRQEVKSAKWQADEGLWLVDILDGATGVTSSAKYDLLINASGVLNSWKLPDVPSLHEFRGDVVHTAQWDSSLVLDDKVVGVIGNGSSGQQVVPAIQPKARKLVHFIRQPAWTFGALGEEPRKYNSEELKEFEGNPDSLLHKRRAFEFIANSYWPICLKGSEAQGYMRTLLEEKMRVPLAGQTSAEALIPTYAVGCQRPATGIGYLEALAKDNVQVVMGNVTGATSNGLVVDEGAAIQVDVVICATGFDTSYIPRFPIIQQNGRNLQDVWAAEVESYLATAVAECPNFFTFCGPMNAFGSGAYLSSVETQADYILKFCDKWQSEHVHSFVPKTEAVTEFMAYARGILENTVWTDNCRSWYKGHTRDSQKLLAWPGSGLHFAEALEHPRFDDFHIKYRGQNRFAWLGNGFSSTEVDPQGDKAFYIRKFDDGPILGREKRRKLRRRLDPTSSANSKKT